MNAIDVMERVDSNWYCLRTKRYKESWVVHQLMESCEEVYLPLLREQRRIRRQYTWKIEPLFPGYLFARFVIRERFRAVRYTPGVIGVVSSLDNGLITVDQAIIAALRERSHNGCIEVQPTPFFPGEELEITEGPFQGLRALFQQELKAGERVAVLLELLSSRVRVELPREYVQQKLLVHRLQSVA